LGSPLSISDNPGSHGLVPMLKPRCPPLWAISGHTLQQSVVSESGHRLVSHRMYAVPESEIELHFGGSHARTVVGYLRTGCFVLIELLSTNRFRNMPPIWKSWHCCRDLRSRAWQRAASDGMGAASSRKLPSEAHAASAKPPRRIRIAARNRSGMSPAYLLIGPQWEFSRQMAAGLLPGSNAQ